jgi:hypothetical protein
VYTINGVQRTQPYYLVDGIYPSWSIFVSSITEPYGQKQEWFVKMQEAHRKDVERAFGVLQIKFQVLVKPSQQWNVNNMRSIILCCIILHNMMVEFNGYVDGSDLLTDEMQPQAEMHNTMPTFNQILLKFQEVTNTGSSLALKMDLVEHLWIFKGQQP